jgi:hypothetical protein
MRQTDVEIWRETRQACRSCSGSMSPAPAFLTCLGPRGLLFPIGSCTRGQFCKTACWCRRSEPAIFRLRDRADRRNRETVVFHLPDSSMRHEAFGYPFVDSEKTPRPRNRGSAHIRNRRRRVMRSATHNRCSYGR